MQENNTIPRLNLTVETGFAGGRHFIFKHAFRIGRHPVCEVCLEDSVVSRFHAEIKWESGQWWIVDLQSANGIFVNGARVDKVPLPEAGRVQLGSAGPALVFDIEHIKAPSAVHTVVEDSNAPGKSGTTDTTSLEHYKSHYFGKDGSQKAGQHTIMVRRAYAEVQKKQRLTYMAIIGFVVLLLVITGGIAVNRHLQVVKQRKLAAEVFYTMRSLEIDLIKLRSEAEKLRSVEAKIQIDVVQTQKDKLEQNYNRYVDSLDVYSKGLSEKEKIILRMAHRFGECEINMPKGFAKEVMGFIEKWHSSARLRNVIERAQRLGYIPRIVRAMAKQQLPAQFFYLALQESNLNHRAVGPQTRFGIAKGMWQFIPSTAEKYGLQVGPLKNEPVMDMLDERHDFAKSTAAAARYLKDIYTTDAQASGLLVMASYNWGEQRVIELIKSMPANPRDRNFWQFISKYRDKIPEETYDYVFSIFSAAVIGENPRLFGFDFDNPLSLENKSS